MDEFISSGDDKLSFRVIMLEHLRGILGITIRGGQAFTFSYSQSVLSLSDVLLPFYDKDMKKDYKDFEKEVEELDSHKGVTESKVNKVYRKLFRNLNALLSRSNYMKASIYTEEDE